MVLYAKGKGYTHVLEQLTDIHVATLHGQYSLSVPQGGQEGGGRGVVKMRCNQMHLLRDNLRMQ